MKPNIQLSSKFFEYCCKNPVASVSLWQISSRKRPQQMVDMKTKKNPAKMPFINFTDLYQSRNEVNNSKVYVDVCFREWLGWSSYWSVLHSLFWIFEKTITKMRCLFWVLAMFLVHNITNARGREQIDKLPPRSKLLRRIKEVIISSKYILVIMVNILMIILWKSKHNDKSSVCF